jgi:hypothetical protein
MNPLVLPPTTPFDLPRVLSITLLLVLVVVRWKRGGGGSGGLDVVERLARVAFLDD